MTKAKALWTDEGLAALDLRNRGLTEVPGVERLTKLLRASLDHNALAVLPTGLGELAGLRFLTVSHNPLTELEESVASRLSLFELDVSHTQLATLPRAAQSWPLHTLRMMNLPESFRWDEALESLDASRLGSLSVGGNASLAAHTGLLGRFTELRVLHLNDCALTALSAALGALTKLETLSLAVNELEALPEEVLALPALRSLVLKGNPGARRLKAALKKRGSACVVT